MKKHPRIKGWLIALSISAAVAGAHAYAVHSDRQAEPATPAYHA